jgi:ubiquinone/menaquinone biosynthesis C-methylase UbiE
MQHDPGQGDAGRGESRETARQREVWEAAADGYDHAMTRFERTFIGDGREWIGARAHGRVLEVAVGTGRSLPFYPPGVEIVGIDLSPRMLEQTRGRAAELGIPIELHEGDAERLPFADGSFDTVVSELALCSIPRPDVAIAEFARVLRPGGSLLLLDHVASTWPPVHALQWLVERVTIRAAGEHFTRRQLPLVESAGLRIDESVRTKTGAVERLRATKP